MNNQVMTVEASSALVRTAHIVYALHALGLALGAFGAATVIGSFLFGWPSIIAVIVNYIYRSDARGTWLESHFRWQIRTFWFALLWIVVAGVISAPLVLLLGLGILTFFLAALIVAIWIVYRVARGWLALRDKRTMYT